MSEADGRPLTVQPTPDGACPEGYVLDEALGLCVPAPEGAAPPAEGGGRAPEPVVAESVRPAARGRRRTEDEGAEG